ncbi:MAG: hypothetical protein RJB08_1089 [Actinomycetota bacterium]
MSITESQRFELHQVLRNELGVSVADTLMEHLPPSGWSDVARRADLETIRKEIVNEINATVTEKLNSQLRWTIGLFAAQFVALTAIPLR